jgi:hypothetical protein
MSQEIYFLVIFATIKRFCWVSLFALPTILDDTRYYKVSGDRFAIAFKIQTNLYRLSQSNVNFELICLLST